MDINENYQVLKSLIGKTISDVDCYEVNPDRFVINILTSDGDIINIDAEGDYDLFVNVKYYLSIGE